MVLIRPDKSLEIRPLATAEIIAHLDRLGTIMAACVQSGASIGYILPFDAADGMRFWQSKILPGVTAGTTIMLGGFVDGVLAGTACLDHDLPPNQPHRADVKKLMVDPHYRRLGLARALMLAIEGEARALALRLLVLDTKTGDGAEPLYLSIGYEIAGIIPDYCIDAIDHTRSDATTVMFKRLG